MDTGGGTHFLWECCGTEWTHEEGPHFLQERMSTQWTRQEGPTSHRGGMGQGLAFGCF